MNESDSLKESVNGQYNQKILGIIENYDKISKYRTNILPPIHIKLEIIYSPLSYMGTPFHKYYFQDVIDQKLIDKILQLKTFDLTKTVYDSDIEVEEESISFLCPLSLGRKLLHPVKGLNCKHKSCFDLEILIRMNEKSLGCLK